MKSRFDLLVFDWDGTLIDSIESIVASIQQAALQCGCDVPSDDAAKAIIGLALNQAVDRLFPDVGGELAERLMVEYRAAFRSRPITRHDLFAGVRTMLHQLRDAGYLLAIATGKNRAGLQHALDSTGIGDLFSATRCADETVSKPSPVMLQELLAELGVAAERAVMIGDTTHDLQMAERAGVEAIGVSCGAHSMEALIVLKPLLCLRQTVDLGEYLI